jgi:hypothetical protein
MFRKKSFAISIANPCNEKWDEMSETDKGKFCGNCRKEVIDFSDMTDVEIFKTIKTDKIQVCGRFDETQLNREILHNNKKYSFNYKKIAAGIIALLSFRYSYSQSLTTSKADTTISPASNKKHSITEQPKGYIVYGKISSDSLHASFAGNLEVLIGDRKTTVHVDSLGSYKLILDKEDIKEVTIISFIRDKFTTVVRSLHNTMFPVEVNVFFETKRAPARRYFMGNKALIDSSISCPKVHPLKKHKYKATK